MDSRFEELVAVNRAITRSLDYEELLDLVVKKATELCNAERCVLLLENGATVAEVAAQRGIGAHRAASFEAPLDERIDQALQDGLGFGRNRDFLAVPVVHRDRIKGLLAVQCPSADARDGMHEFLLSALADQAAIALDHASRYRRLLEQSTAARLELEMAARQKDEFLAMLAHELRNPIAAISTALEVMKSYLPDNPRLGRVRQGAEHQSKHMARLLDDLLDASRITRGKIALRLGTAVVQEIVDQAVLSVDLEVRRRQHSLHVDMPSEPVFLHCDAGRLVQVLTNLLDNAIKYTTPPGNIWLTVREAGRQLEIRVRDDGMGIREDVRSHVFDLFMQNGQEGAEKPSGLGIGLTLVERLVGLHDGSVQVSSDGPGQGCEFVVRLPMAAEAEPQPAPGREREQDPEPERKKRRVLLVEDNTDVAAAIVAWLELRGHRVDVASNGGEALAAARENVPDIVLLDIGLPDMDGFQLARTFRREVGSEPLLVAVTGYGSDADFKKGRQAGIDRHLVKPVDLQQLGEIVAAAGSENHRRGSL